MVHKIVGTIFIIIGWSSGVIGQITVTGKVVERGSGETLPYASVGIQNTMIGTNSNLDGFFILYDVPSDTSTLLISYVGYEVVKFKLSQELADTSVLIELAPLSTNLQEVVVSAEGYKVLQANSGVSVATLSTKQLALLPSIGEVDIFRSLQLLPGVSSTNQSSAGLYVRGGTPEQNLVLLDGITVYKVDHFFGFFSAFNANAVKDVKIYKGAYPARYGGRVSSVVDMNLKTGSFQKPSASVGMNFFAFNGQVETPIGDKVAVMLAGRRSFNGVLNSSFFRDLRDNLMSENEFSNVEESDNVIIREVNPDFYFWDINTKISYRPSSKDMITLSYYGGKDFLDESRDLKATIPVGADKTENRLLAIDIQSTTDWGNKGTSVKWSRQWTNKLYTNLIGAQSQYFSKYNRDASLALTIPAIDSTIISGSLTTFEDNKVKDHSVRFDFEWKLNAKHTVESGFVFINTDIDYLNVRDDSISVLERREEAVYKAIYVSDTWELTPKFSITTGLRIGFYDFSNQAFVSSRFSGIYQLTDRVKFKLGYGKFYQYVNRIINENISEGSRDFWLLADNDLVPVSFAHHYVAGVSYETNGWLFDVESYYKRLTGLSEFTLRFRTAGTLDPEHLFISGNGKAKGVELLIQKKSGQYTGWLAYTLGLVTNRFEGFNDGNPFPALHDKLHEIKIVQSVDVEDWTLSSVFIYGSGKAYSKPSGQYSVELLDGRKLNYIGVGDKNGSRLKSYTRLDLSAHNKFTRGSVEFELGFSVFNVLNRKNTSYFQYDFQQSPAVITEITYLGVTPNISLNIKF